MVFWSKRWHQKDILKLTDLYEISTLCHPNIHKETVKSFGSPDVLINNAGIYRSSTVGNINYDEWLESFKINTIAPYQIVEAFLNQIINSDLKKVVSITSKMGSIDDNTSGGSYIYRSSKTALNSMMQSLSHDIKHHGIATLTLHPGWVRTDMGGMGGWIDAHESVQGMIKQIEKLTINNSGKYIDYAGKSINW